MNLFERIKNIRKNNLQEKMKFPGGTGDIGFNAPKRGEKVRKRLTRADKLGTPDPFDADYDKKVKKVDGRTKVGKVFKSTKPVTTSAPGFGKGDTPGQTRVKGLEKKAFKKTQPKDIKLPQSFKDFSTKLRRLKSDIQDVKDKDIATMRTGKSSSKVKVSGANNQTRQDVGMAPPDTPKKTKPQKGVSAIETTKKFDKIRAEKAIKNQQSKLSKTAADLEKQTEKIDAAKQKLRSATGTKDVKKIRQLNVQGREYRKLTQATKKAASGVGNPNAPVKYNKMTAGADFIKKNQVGKKTGSQLFNQNEIGGAKTPTGEPKLPKFANISAKGYKRPKGPQLATDIKVRNVPREVRFAKTSQKVLAKTPKAIKPIARPALKLLARAGTPGRIAAAGLGVAAISPAGRKALGQLATGTGLTALFGRGKKEKQLKVGDGLKNVGKVRVTADSRGLKRNQADMAKIKATQKNFIDKYNKGRTFGKIKYNVNKQGTYDVIKPKKK